MHDHLRGTFLAALSAACFGALGIFGRYAYEGGANVTTLLAVRFTAGTLLFWAWILVTGIPYRVDRRSVAILCLLGTAGYGSVSALYFISIKFIPVSLAAILLYTHPALVFLLACLVGDEHFDARKLVALLGSFTGVVLILKEGAMAGIVWIGAIAILSAAVIYSLYIVISNRVLHRVIPIVAASYISTAAAGLYIFINISTGQWTLDMTLPAWLASLGVAIFCTFIAITALFEGIRLIGPSKAAIVSTLEPLVTVLLSAALFMERLTPIQMAGGILVIGCISWLQMGKTKGVAKQTKSAGSTVLD